MTAEIAILNKSGVALAADSAVTIEVNRRQRTDKKIYNSSNKVFALSKFYPVGIMIFGNATFMGFPWEVIIKKYRNKLWDKQYDKIEDYADDFLNYCISFVSIEDQEDYFKRNVSLYFSTICSDIKKEVREKTIDNSTITLIEIRQVINRVINKHFSGLQGRNNLETIPENFNQTVLFDRKEVVDEQIDGRFEKLPLTKREREKLQQIAGLLFIKDIFPRDISGVVFTGYGKIQHFPSIIELSIDGVIDNTIKYKKNRKFEITKDSDSIIVPFAQNEMVCTFMEGVNPDYQEMINGAISMLLVEYPKILLDGMSLLDEKKKKELLSLLIKKGETVKKEILENFDKYRNSFFVSPVLNAVGALPKDEMAIMAETLVNLTSFKRKMSLEAETVGGPIDVAVISKGDGFVWIKRKHYFNPDLNHQFFKNYYNKIDDSEEL